LSNTRGIAYAVVVPPLVFEDYKEEGVLIIAATI
jgi:hypothetical protein